MIQYIKKPGVFPSMASIYKPRFWLAWLGMGILWLAAQFPYRTQLRIGRGIGFLLQRFSSKSRHITSVNLNLCFPELNPAQRESLLKKNFACVGMGLMEAAMAWWGNAEKLMPLFHVHGLECLEPALKKGKGVLLCSAHFSPLELGGRLLSQLIPFTVMYRPQKHPVFNAITYKYRSKFYNDIIARNDLRKLVRQLKENKIVWYTPDIDGGAKNSVFVPFFGIQTASLTMTARIAQMTGATVIPVVGYRREDESGYDIYIGPSIENYPSGDIETDTSRVNELFEAAIRHKPEEYLWQYKRFKTRPFGEARFYK